MRILIIGQGGREHALAWKVASSKQVAQVYVAPGNAGTALEEGISNIGIQATDIEQLLQFAEREAIDLTIVGPEAPLALGIVDQFTAKGLRCFGPTQQAAQLESSKIFCKQFLADNQIPTARYASFDDVQAAVSYLEQQAFPIVIKADGLAAGKGVVIAENLDDAKACVTDMLSNQQFGEASTRIVIEEFLQGTELSFIALVDGVYALPLATSQDHKRRDNNNQGPNTGGMGAYSPAPQCDASLHETIMQQIINPTVAAMAKAGTPYTGFLYAGLMITPEGEPKVLEFNCRLGDPEAEPLLMRLQSDLVSLCHAALEGELSRTAVTWDPRSALSVVMTAGGYPFDYQRGDEIVGLNSNFPADIKVFHAGTALKDNAVTTNGGRVLVVTALGEDITAAQQQAYRAVKQINWAHCYYRTDIGFQAVALEQKV